MRRAKINRKTKGKVAHKKRGTRKNRKVTRRVKGGCGCNSTIFKGGNINPASFDGNLPIRYYYGQNDYQNDPSASIAVESARNLPGIIKGGRRKRNSKKIKGGDMLLGSAYSNNPVMSFGTIDGARNSVDLLYGSTTVNPSVYNQPILNGHTSNNPPLA
jgi:hypothetical protein